MKPALKLAMFFLVLTSVSSCIGENAEQQRTPPVATSKPLLVYAASDGNDTELYFANIAEKNSFKLTNNEINDSTPFPTPDGSKVAWQCDDGNNQEICFFDVKSKKATQLTSGDLDFFPITWLADGDKLLISHCTNILPEKILFTNSDTEGFSIPPLDLENTCGLFIADIATGQLKEITPKQTNGIPGNTEHLYLEAASPISDMMILKGDDKLYILNTQNYSARVMNTGNLNLLVGPWLKKNELLMISTGENDQCDIMTMDYSGKLTRLKSGLTKVRVCIEENTPEVFDSCLAGMDCLDERWKMTPSAVVGSTQDGKLFIYDIKSGMKKMSTLGIDSGSPRLMCNGSDRVVIYGSSKLQINKLPEGDVETVKTLSDSDGFPITLSPSGQYLVFSTTEEPEANDEEINETGVVEIKRYIKLMKLPRGGFTKLIESKNSPVFTNDDKYFYLSDAGTFDSSTGDPVDSSAGTFIPSDSSAPVLAGRGAEDTIVIMGDSAETSLSLSGEIPVSVSDNMPERIFSWLKLSKDEVENISDGFPSMEGFAPTPQTPSARLNTMGTWPPSELSFGSGGCPFEVGSTCNASFNINIRKKNPEFLITVKKSNGDELPSFMKFNQNSNCLDMTNSFTSYYNVPSPWSYATSTSTVQCQIVASPLEGDEGTYDLVAHVVEKGVSGEKTVPIKIIISKSTETSE